MALAVTPMPVAARGPAGGYEETDRYVYGESGSSAAPGPRAPLEWLRSSSRSFQSLMRMLAQRAADVGGAARRPLPPAPAPEPAAPEPDVTEPYLPPPLPKPEHTWRPERGGEAKAGRDRSVAARIRKWRRRAAWCRYAGFEVPDTGWYVVRRGDTLWDIAEAHYGYGRAYRRIWRANPERIVDPNLIYPCQQLYITQRRYHRSLRPEKPRYTPPPRRPRSWQGAEESPRRGSYGAAHGGRNASAGEWEFWD